MRRRWRRLGLDERRRRGGWRWLWRRRRCGRRDHSLARHREYSAGTKHHTHLVGDKCHCMHRERSLERLGTRDRVEDALADRGRQLCLYAHVYGRRRGGDPVDHADGRCRGRGYRAVHLDEPGGQCRGDIGTHGRRASGQSLGNCLCAQRPRLGSQQRQQHLDAVRWQRQSATRCLALGGRLRRQCRTRLCAHRHRREHVDRLRRELRLGNPARRASFT